MPPRILAVSFALAAGEATVYAQADPAVQSQLYGARARGDVHSAVELFTDDSVIDTKSGLCAKAPRVGKSAIQKTIER